jgi:peptidoglycan hydrolase-like protein with peptidoglycan-binding domain
MAARAAYGGNRWAGVNPNADHGWGGFQWPDGVPGNLLAVVTIPGGIKVVVRREIAELVGLAFAYIDQKWGRRFTRGWTGGYENRPISGTQSPSNHSKGKALDLDAQDNPMSHIWQCNIDPEIVAFLEEAGFYWGGRYSGKTDPMHFEFCLTPSQVPGRVTWVKTLLAQLGVVPATTPAQPAPSPAAPATPAAKPFPLPSGYYYGPKSGPNESVSNLVNPKPAWLQGLKDAQARLNVHLTRANLPLLKVDGEYGDKTRSALVWFQRIRGLNDDGLLGPKTWASLQQ